LDIEKYISSGILEAYALGDLAREERIEVERMLSLYPEIRAELAVIEETLESIAFHTAVAPGEGLKEKILQQAFPDEGKQEDHRQQKKEDKVIPLQPKGKEPHSGKAYKYLLAAAVTFTVLSTAAATFFWNKWQDAENRLSILALENTRIAEQFQNVNSRLQDLSQELAIYSGDHFNRIELEGLSKTPDANAIVFWNKKTGEVFLNPSDLPATPSGKQYQLWAIVGDQPVDIGLVTAEKNGGLLKMKEIENAAAFAITLEPAGGSKIPTLDQMYVLGKTS
jgi:anti-sigma-K factor RskA